MRCMKALVRCSLVYGNVKTKALLPEGVAQLQNAGRWSKRRAYQACSVVASNAGSVCEGNAHHPPTVSVPDLLGERPVRKSFPEGVGGSLNESIPRSAYVHIPFCRRRCFYCDFPIQVVGDNVKSRHVSDGMDAYVDVVCREIAIAARHGSGGKPLDTVYFGGGTPSLIHPELLERIVTKLEDSFGIASDAEISMEMDPGTFDPIKLQCFRDAGVNRVSLGVQAFEADLLKACGRAHGLPDVYEAIDMIKGGGISNWSLDLISSLPNQTMDDWNHSLSEVLKAGPSHVSVYDLQVEEGTPFARWYQPGQQPLPTDTLSADIYSAASETLRSAGFDHYEVSNYARPGQRCRHNLTYWSGRPFHAFGLGAASYINRQRFTRPRKMAEYVQWVSEYKARQGRIDWPVDSIEEQFLDSLMLGLRLADGIELNAMTSRFGAPRVAAVCGAISQFVESGHVLALNHEGELISQVEWQSLCKELGMRMRPFRMPQSWEESTVKLQQRVKRLRLSDPMGFLMSNDVIASLFNMEDVAGRRAEVVEG